MPKPTKKPIDAPYNKGNLEGIVHVIVRAILLVAATASIVHLNPPSTSSLDRRIDISNHIRGNASTEHASNETEALSDTSGSVQPVDEPVKLSLLQQIAPMIFPMEPEGPTTIRFPASVQHIVIDVGARESDYLKTMEQQLNPSIALIMVDPLPESVLPLMSSAANYNMKGLTKIGQYPHPDYGDHIFVIKGAMGERETIANFQVASNPGCGSLLRTTEGNKFGCWETNHQLPVNIFRLESLLNMIPTSIQTIHLKTDCEGADHFALKGAGQALHRVSTVVIECSPPPDTPRDGLKLRREGMCNDKEVMEWMCSEGRNFCGQRLIPQGGLSNIMFWDQQRLLSPDQIPSFLTQSLIQFNGLYQDLKNKLSASTA